MKLLRAKRSARLPIGASGIVLYVFLLAGAPAARGQGGCIVSPPSSFEPNPPGPAAPRNVGQLSPVGFNHLSLFQNGAGGPWRIFMQETFGYSTLDLSSNPAQPSVLRYDYFPLDTNKVPIFGDGQSYTQAITASPDGARVALSLNGPIPAWANTVVGYPDGNNGWTLWGDTAPVGGVGNAILKSGSRYVHYGMTSDQFWAADVTNQPGTFAGSNIASERTAFPGGARLSAAGNYLVYTTNTGDIQVIDASNPGAVGSIAGGFPRTTIPSSSAMFAGHSLGATKAAVDPGNSKQLWILAELQPIPGVENSPSYALLSVTEDLAGNFGAAVSAGPLFRVPSVLGDNWTSAGSSSYLAEQNGTIYVLMWAFRRTPSFQYKLYSTTTSAWTTGSFGVPQTITDPTFSLGEMKTLASGNTLYGYMASGTSAWVIPMSCTAPNAKATAALTAVNPITSATVNSGDAVVYGETLTFGAQVLPTPTTGQSSELVGFKWNIDFDFHAGNFNEDFGVGLSPRIKNNDNGEFGNSPVPPSGTFPFVGPCDPKNGGVRGFGTGCWASVTTNAAQGGPDFTGSEAAGALKPLILAFEANNTNGSNGPNLFTINWKRPTIGLASTQILGGDPLVASYDGHPQSDGTHPWKWYLDGTLVSCNTSACIPAGANATSGTHNYWVTVPYAQIGYSTPDYAGTAMGTYTVTTFVPTFAVNGSTTGPVGTTPSGTITVANSSKRAAGITGGYTYCTVLAGSSCLANDYKAWSMADPTSPNGVPASSATIPNPGVGNWLLKIRVNYTGGLQPVDWPSSSGIPLFITNSLIVSANVSPNPANSGDTVVFHCSATGGSGSYNYKWSGQFGDVAFTQDYSTRVTNGSASSSSFSLDCTASDAISGAFGSGTAAVTVLPGAPAAAPNASASVSPNPVEVSKPATFFCTGTGGTGALSYQWTDSQFHTLSQAQSYGYTPNSVAPVSLTCTVTDGASKTATSTATLIVTPPPGPACPAVDWGVYLDGVEIQPTPGQFGLEFPRTASVGTPLLFSIKSGVSSQFQWTWGDSQVTTLTLAQYQANPPVHAYTTTGMKTVTLKPMFVDDSAFCGGRSYDIQITGPNANFTPGYVDGSPFVVSDVTAGKAVRFSASENGATSYDWDFGDGLPHGSGQVATHVFLTAGARTVTLTVVKGVTVSSSLTLTLHLPPEPPKWVVPGMAYLGGSGGAFWTSDVTIFNPDKVLTQKLSVAFLDPKNLVSDYSQLTFVPLADIPPMGSLGASNALQALGKPEGSYGALLFKGTLGQQTLAPVVVTRTFNDQTLQGKGTFGLSVPSASASTGGVTAQAAPAVQMLVGLRHDASARTNLALVNLNNEWPTVKLDLYDGRTNSIIGSKTLPLNPYQVLQVDRILETVGGAGSTSDLFKVQVSVVDSSGGAHAYAVYPYATVIDAYSTDPIVVTPTSSPAAAYRIPGIVRLTGANGEKFRSRVTVSNPSSSARIVRMTYSFVSCDARGACSDRRSYSATIGMTPGQTQAWDDWVKVWFQAKYFAQLDENGSYLNSLLDVTSDDGNTDPLVVLGETYDDLGTAADGTTLGHVGLQVPGYPAVDGASRTGSGANGNTRLALAGLRTDAAYRTNLALFVTGGTAGGWCRVRVYSPEGTKLGNDVPVEVRPVMQISGSSLLAGISGSLARYSLVIDNFDDGITVGGYATIIDNTSADSTFVKAQPVP